MIDQPTSAPSTERRRVDIRDKVTGVAQYIEDLPDLPGTAYAVPIRSPYSHARIVSVDASNALAQPGVLAVLDPASLADYDLHIYSGLPTAVTGVPEHFIATDRARFDGDVVGMVVAEDLRTAQRAAELVDFEWDHVEPLFSADAALAPGAPVLHENVGTNIALQDSLEWGDVDQGFAEADYIYEGTFTSPTIYHHPIEPAMSVVANYTADGIEMWTSSSGPFNAAESVAQLLGVSPEHIRVHIPYVGGNFGAKHSSVEMLATVALSMKVGRPVKYMADEADSFRMTARHAADFKAKVGVKRDGTLVAMDVDLTMDTGAYFTGARVVTGNAVTSSYGGYRLPNFRVRACTVYSNKVPASMFRNTGKNETAFGIDCAMDAVARHLSIPPIEFRARNLLHRGETIPAQNWKRDGKPAPARIPLMDTDYGELLEQAVAAIGWDGRTPGPLAVEGKPHRVRGRGMAASVRRGSSIGSATARATLNRDGVVTIAHNAPDVGEGAHTVISVVAAGTLGLSQDQVQVGQPDTANKLPFSGSSSQRVTVQMGNAVRNACEQLKQEVLRLAAETFGSDGAEWRLEDGMLRRDGTAVTLADLAGRLPEDAALTGEGEYVHGGPVVNTSFGDHDHWSPGVAAVEIEVDTETGDIQVLQYAAVADAGTIIHFHSAKGQIEGGAVMGFGAALTEEMVYGEGQLLNADPFQYRLPLMSDVPEQFQTIILEHGDGPGPFGSKGIAQTSIPCVAPAIGNAIFDAIGARLDTIPFTPEKILRALGKLSDET
jgi:CO/xanthine dehydrogenase Mo-binding subunit